MKKPQCSYCKSTRNVKYYIIADDIEKSRAMCSKCKKEFDLQCLINLEYLKDMFYGENK